MKDNSTMDVKEYIRDFIFLAFISMIWYRNLIFRCFSDWTYKQSMRFLCGMLIAALFAGTFVFFKYNRTEWTVVVILLITYGCYTVFTYIEIVGRFIKVLLGAAFVLSVLFSSIILTGKIRRKKYRTIILKKRFYRCFCVMQSLVAVSMAVLMISLGLPRIFGTNLLGVSAEAVEGTALSEYTISNNIETILLLQEEEWEKLNINERVDVLQTVANIEARYLGLPNELNVAATNMEEKTLGSYTDGIHTICINLKHLENGSAYEVLETLCHEAYHSYQYRLVEVYQNIDTELLNLRMFKSVEVYVQEFSNYDDGDEDFYDYYSQECEIDAREYGESAARDYYYRISEYLEGQEGGF